MGDINITVHKLNWRNFSIMNSTTGGKVITLSEDNMLNFDVKVEIIDVNLSYSYATMPPLFSDIGDFMYNSNDTNITFNGSLFLNEEDLMETKIKGFTYKSNPCWLAFDGVSDFSHVWGVAGTYAANLAVERLMSISNYVNDVKGFSKLENFTNGILAQVPDEFEIIPHL